MFRVHAVRGVSAAAIGLALAAPPETASAQGGQALPPVTVDAAQSQPRIARRNAARNSAAPARRTQTRAPPPARIYVPAAPEPSASLGPPAAVTRFQLPQQS